MKRRDPRHKDFFVSVIIAMLSFSLLAGCRKATHDQGVNVAYTLPLKSYIALKLAENAKLDGHFYFPTLEIYNSAGHLIYCGRSAPENGNLLRKPPETVDRSASIPNTADLIAVVSELSNSMTAKRIADRRVLTYIAVDLENCHACSVQEHTLEQSKDRILEGGSNLITVSLLREGSL
jgi:hypothetical protein